MSVRRGASLVGALALVATLAACTTSDDPAPPRSTPGRPAGTASTSPTAPTDPTDPADPADPSGGDLGLADLAFWVGPPELVMGPSKYVDSLVNGITVGDTVRAYVGNTHTMLLEGTSVGDLQPTGRHAIEAGTDPDVWDDCGAWLEGVYPDEEDPQLLRAWYHAEWRCDYANNQTDKSVAYAESRDGGRTFTKPGYPGNQVLTSPTGPVEGHHTGRGGPSIIRRGDYFYMYYRSVLRDLTMVSNVARAPVASGGVPGTWRSYTVDGSGVGSWTEDARGGDAAPLAISPPSSSASIHEPSGEVLLVRQHGPTGGIALQGSADGLHFTPLPEPIVPYLESQVRSNWQDAVDGQLFGYTSIVGEDGSRSWSDSFYLFHLYVFPGEILQGERYLVRRRVTVADAPDDGPRSLVALTRYTASDGDRFETSAPVKRSYDARGAVGYLLGVAEPGRRSLFECTAASGDRFLAGACGAGGRRGRLAGYAFTTEQPGTAALLRCAGAAGDGFTTIDPDCERGRRLAGLGWVYPPGQAPPPPTP